MLTVTNIHSSFVVLSVITGSLPFVLLPLLQPHPSQHHTTTTIISHTTIIWSPLYFFQFVHCWRCSILVFVVENGVRWLNFVSILIEALIWVTFSSILSILLLWVSFIWIWFIYVSKFSNLLGCLLLKLVFRI